MERQPPTDRPAEQADTRAHSERHPLTRENSPEETIERMRALPERAAKLKETLPALREANAR
jgi:hypothetical protein